LLPRSNSDRLSLFSSLHFSSLRPLPTKNYSSLHAARSRARRKKKTRIFPLTYPATDLRKYAVIRCRLHGFLRSEGTSGRGSSALLPFRCCCSPHVLSGDWSLYGLSWIDFDSLVFDLPAGGWDRGGGGREEELRRMPHHLHAHVARRADRP
jgi:hypothetical protein